MTIDSLRASNDRLEAIMKSFPDNKEEMPSHNFGELSIRDYCRAAGDSSMRANFWLGFLAGVALSGATFLLCLVLP